jgi:hypothetical protein
LPGSTPLFNIGKLIKRLEMASWRAKAVPAHVRRIGDRQNAVIHSLPAVAAGFADD